MELFTAQKEDHTIEIGGDLFGGVPRGGLDRVAVMGADGGDLDPKARQDRAVRDINMGAAFAG